MADGFPAHVAQFMADHPDPPFEVWEGNWPAFDVFRCMLTQWRVGMSGPTGLDYLALKTVMDIHQVEDQKAMLEEIATMEAAALTVMREMRNG